MTTTMVRFSACRLMVAITVGLICLFWALAPARGADADAAVAVRTARAEQFVDTLVQGKFETAVASFDATMKRALPAPKLEGVWRGLERQAGKFQRRLGHRTGAHGGYAIVFVTCQFERAVVDTRVVFDRDEQIAGLFFTPGKAPSVEAKRDRLPSGIRETDVTIGTGEWALPGTWSWPAAADGKPCAAVVLVHGSGPNDRDETIMANKPFRDLAWGLSAKGIAVLRYDKRTKVHPAKMVALPTLTVKEEVIDDAVAAVRLVRATAGIDPARIYIVGHSLGGMLAPRIAQAADGSVAGLVILAGATRKLEDAIIEQQEYMASLGGPSSEGDRAKLTELRVQVDRIKQLQPGDADGPAVILNAPAAYWLDLRKYDPPQAAARLDLPMLILQGGRDYQVTMKEFETWKRALAGKPKVTFKAYPALNHLFIAGQGKSSPLEYEQPGHVEPEVIDDIAAWIRAR